MSTNILPIVVGLTFAVSASWSVAEAGPPPPSAATGSQDGEPADHAPAGDPVQGPPTSPAETAESSSRTVLLMRDGTVKVFDSPVVEEGADYLVRVPAGSVRVRKDEVEGRFGSMAETYAYQRDHLPDGDPDEHLRLARWCLSNRLEAEAAEQLRALLTLVPGDARARAMLANLKAAVDRPNGRDDQVARASAERVDGGPAGMPRELDVSVLSQNPGLSRQRRGPSDLRPARAALGPPLPGLRPDGPSGAPEPLRELSQRAVRPQLPDRPGATARRPAEHLARPHEPGGDARPGRSPEPGPQPLAGQRRPAARTGAEADPAGSRYPRVPGPLGLGRVPPRRRPGAVTDGGSGSTALPFALRGDEPGDGLGQIPLRWRLRGRPIGPGAGIDGARGHPAPPAMEVYGVPAEELLSFEPVEQEASHPDVPAGTSFQTVSPLMGGPGSAPLTIDGRTILPPGSAMAPSQSLSRPNAGAPAPAPVDAPAPAPVPAGQGPPTVPAPGQPSAMADGSQVVTLPDGTQMITKPDGSQEMKLADGTIVPCLTPSAVRQAAEAKPVRKSLQIDPALLQRLQQQRLGGGPGN